MKFKNLFFATLFAFALIACGSGNKSGNDQKGDETQETLDQIFENGDKNIPGYIEISKESMTLKLYDKNGKIIYNFPVAVGKNLGNKKTQDDLKTPEGEFVILRIEPSSKWTYDFKDGNGAIEGAYGEWFIRLDTESTPYRNIGIHGTHKPETIGTRATDGTISLHNDDLKKLKPLVRIGMKVNILSSKVDMDADGKPAADIVTSNPIVEEPKEEVKVEAPVAEDGDKSIPSHIVISKESMTLKLYDKNGKVIYNFPVAVGKNYGNKQKVGDMKTPEGTFSISEICPASTWTHDFKDGKGQIAGAYGDWFIRLLTPPHTGIGIHGTHAPESIGTRATEGCIRLNNQNLNKLKPLVFKGMKVIIETSKKDQAADQQQVETITYTPGEIIEHTVEKGQLVGHVAIKYNTSTAKILELNPGLVPEKIQIGQKIKVQPNTNTKPAQPAKPVVTEDPNGTYYNVKSGDVLGSIAIKFNTSVAKIKELNNMENDNIRVNQRIRVK